MGSRLVGKSRLFLWNLLMTIYIYDGPPQEDERVITTTKDKSKARGLVAELKKEGRKVRSWFNGVRFLILEKNND